MKTTKVFQHNDGQAVELPDEFHFEGDRVFIKQLGNVMVLFAYNAPYESLVKSLDFFSDDFMETRNQPAQQERENIFGNPKE